MSAITLRAHFDGKAIRLDEEFELPIDTQLLITILPSADQPQDGEWKNLGAAGLARAYGEHEPEYSEADVVP